MRAILEFKLPEEETDYKLCIRANDLMLALSDIKQEIRTLRKYTDLSEVSAIKVVEELWNELHNILQDRTLLDLLD